MYVFSLMLSDWSIKFKEQNTEKNKLLAILKFYEQIIWRIDPSRLVKFRSLKYPCLKSPIVLITDKFIYFSLFRRKCGGFSERLGKRSDIRF